VGIQFAEWVFWASERDTEKDIHQTGFDGRFLQLLLGGALT